MSKWVYLTDMAPQATIMSLENGTMRNIMSAAVKDKAPRGLRRGVLEENTGGVYVETGEYVSMADDLLSDMEDVYRTPNSWNYDWPHMQIEQDADADPTREAHVRSRLTAMMAQHPYEFEIVGLQRRYLMYFSDGSYTSQQKFISLIPNPADATPYRRDGQLRRKYEFAWDSIMRDAKVPFPKENEKRYGGLRPCLYMGAAWVVRFRIDEQDPLLDRCRVYVDDDANFICSDWCQRHDFSSYNNGINLQTGIYTFDGWVVNSCITQAMSRGTFKPKDVVIKREAVRELLKKTHVLSVPSYDDTYAKAKAAVDKYAKSPVPTTPVVPTVDAGPITADVVAEAMVAYDQLLTELAQAKAEAIAAGTAPVVPPVPQRLSTVAHKNVRAQENGVVLIRVPAGVYGEGSLSYQQSADQYVYLRVTQDDQGRAVLAMRDAPLAHALHPDFSHFTSGAAAMVTQDPASETGWWYNGTVATTPVTEPLNPLWYAWSVVQYWQDELTAVLPPIGATLASAI